MPIDPKITIDAQGNITSGADATRSFVSRSTRPVIVTNISSEPTSTTKAIFPTEAQWRGIKVTLTDPEDPYGTVEVKLNGSLGVSRHFEIPAAEEGATSKLLIEFGLSLPQGIDLAYSDGPEGTPAALLQYTFELG